MYENFEKLNPIDVASSDSDKNFTFKFLNYQPLYHRVNNYSTMGTPVIFPLEYTGWRDEALACQITCAITTNLNPAPAIRVSGPDAAQFLKDNLINNIDKFPIGSSKHGVMCVENGNIVSNGVILRSSEDTYEAHWLSPFLNFAFTKKNYDALLEDITESRFIFQLIGPKSLEIVEESANEDFHDLKMTRFRDGTIAGKKVRVLRFGMTGGLAYEIHGDSKDAKIIHRKLTEIGNNYGLRLLGLKAYMLSHTPGGSVQFGMHYAQDMPSALLETLMIKDKENIGSKNDMASFLLNGSVGANMEKRYKNVYEVGLEKLIDYSHDFVGKKALEKYRDNRKRTMVTLKWNAEDIADVYESQFKNGEPYFPFERPGQMTLANHQAELSMDYVYDKNGKEIGTSGGRTFSPWHQVMLSMASIDIEYTELDTEVIVLWGDEGSNQKRIRATVVPTPYNTNYSNWTYDIEQIPRLTDKEKIK